MFNKWQILPRQTPLKEMIIEEEEEGKETGSKQSKFHERKKRNFSEMTMGISASKSRFEPIEKLKTDSYIPERTYLPSKIQENIVQPTYKLASIISEPIKNSRNEAIKVMAGESLEKYLFLDEKLVDVDRSIGASNVNQRKTYHLILDFSKRNNINYLVKQRMKYPEVLKNIFHNQGTEKFSFSGLFLPLNVLYFVRDNVIFLWDFMNNEFSSYREISNVIVNLHFTLAKPGVFSPEITFILIAATTTEIYILLVTKIDKTLKLVKSDFVFDIQSVITSITSTSERRVFLGSENYYLYELDYTNESSFFGYSRKARKITHSSQSFFEKIVPNIFNFKKHSYIAKLTVDNTRNILYALTYFTRSENSIYNLDSVYDSVVDIYDLGVDGLKFNKLGEITQTSIKERFDVYSSNTNSRRGDEFIVLDVYPVTRAESKYYNLVILTRMGLRAYISFDTYISNEIVKNEEKLIDFDKNKINRARPSMKYTTVVKQIPEPSNATVFEGVESDKALRLLQKNLTYNQIFYIDKKFLIFYKDDSKKRSYIDIVEYEEAESVKLQESHFMLNTNRSKETISNVLKFDLNKEVYAMAKVPNQSTNQQFDNDFLNLLKLYEYDICIPRNTNFLDSNEHTSFSFLSSFAKQLFLSPEEMIVMTSSELITMSKLRPIDNLYKILSDLDYNAQIFSEDFLSFINENGLNETSFMLVTIMTNKSYIFYRKLEENLQNETVQSENINNVSKILMMDSCEIRNNEKLMYSALLAFLQLVELSLPGKHGVVKERKIEPIRIYETNFIGGIVEEAESKKTNYLTYGMYIYLSRLARVFWEEPIVLKSMNANEIATESVKIPHLKYLHTLLSDFQRKIVENKDRIIQKTSQVENELKTRNVSNYDFANISQELDEVIYISQKMMETLDFVEILYELKQLKITLFKLPKNIQNEMTYLKFKNIILNTNMSIVKMWIEEYFDTAMCHFDYINVGNKLDEMSERCPTILSQNDKDVITANMLIKLSKSKINDEISRKNLVTKAVNLICQNPDKIKLEKSVTILSEMGEERSIVEICIKKAIYLKALLDKMGRNPSDFNIDNISSRFTFLENSSKASLKYTLSQSETDQYISEYRQALTIILKLLNEVHFSLKHHGQVYTSDSPSFIKNLLASPNLTYEDKLAMKKTIIEEVLKYENKFLHDLIFDHLKSSDMLEDILIYKSPFIEVYLGEQIEKEKANPKRYEALYKFYFNTKNYQAAIRILFNLVNFDNSILENGGKYVSLADRKTYINHLLHALEYVLESGEEIENRNIITSKRTQIIEMKENFSIQSELFLIIKNIHENLLADENRSQHMIDITIDTLENLDRNYLSITQLLETAKKFSTYELIFRIFFEMNSRNFNIQRKEVIEMYDNFFEYIKKRVDFKWPQVVFSLFKNIFSVWSINKTNYDSFSSMLIDNNLDNILDHLIPLDYLIQKVESLNWALLLENKEIDIETVSMQSYDTPENPFCCYYIYGLYTNCRDSNERDEKENFTFNLNMMNLIKLWCRNVELYFSNVEKNNTNIPKGLFSDFHKFEQMENSLQEFLREIYINFNKANSIVDILIQPETKRKIVTFCQNVENKLQYVVNYYLKVSKTKAFELQMIGRYQKNEPVATEDIFEKYKSDRRRDIQSGSNILDQCD